MSIYCTLVFFAQCTTHFSALIQEFTNSNILDGNLYLNSHPYSCQSVAVIYTYTNLLKKAVCVFECVWVSANVCLYCQLLPAKRWQKSSKVYKYMIDELLVSVIVWLLFYISSLWSVWFLAVYGEIISDLASGSCCSFDICCSNCSCIMKCI